MKKIIYYTNQFFGQIGGESEASSKPMYTKGKIGAANAFTGKLNGEVIGTIICGDNFYAENMQIAREMILDYINDIKPDLLIAGPAFNAGRFGLACGDICTYIQEKLNIPTVTGMYEENPAVEMYRKKIIILQTANSAAGMKEAVNKIAVVANKMLSGEELSSPEIDHYIPRGLRKNVFKEKTGAQRAMDMLIAKINNQPFETEIPIPTYESVIPAKGISDMSKAKIAIITTGGVVPMGNPDHLPAATAKFYKSYSIADLDQLNKGEYEAVHAGYDPVYANENPNIIIPLDLLRKKEKNHEIGSLFNRYFVTTGNSTSVADATRMGEEIAKELVENQIDGAIITSTWGTCTRCGATIVKQIEKAGIPAAHICTVTPISKTVGVVRIVPAIAIPYPVGKPQEEPEKSEKLRMAIIDHALKILTEDY